MRGDYESEAARESGQADLPFGWAESLAGMQVGPAYSMSQDLPTATEAYQPPMLFVDHNARSHIIAHWVQLSTGSIVEFMDFDTMYDTWNHFTTYAVPTASGHTFNYLGGAEAPNGDI
jgi:hypothetical protein